MEQIMAFFLMGGHGFYIWLSYGVAAFVMTLEAWFVWRRYKKASVGYEKIKKQIKVQEGTRYETSR